MRYFCAKWWMKASLALAVFAAITATAKDIKDENRIPLVIYGGVGADRNAREISQLLRVLTQELGFDSSDDIPFYRTDPEPGMPINAFGACIFTQGLEQLKDAKEFNVIGVSQGGLNARHILELCDLKAKVRNFITLGAPNMGLAELGPQAGDPDYVRKMNEFAKQFCTYTVFQFAIAPCSYFRDTRSQETYQNYLEYSWFLARLNNENDHTSSSALQRKSRVTSLNQWLAVYFNRDGIVSPKESAIFSSLEVPEQAGGERQLVQVFDTEMYKEDWLGLKTLYDAGKLKLTNIDNAHVTFSDDEIRNMMVPVLKS